MRDRAARKLIGFLKNVRAERWLADPLTRRAWFLSLTPLQFELLILRINGIVRLQPVWGRAFPGKDIGVNNRDPSRATLVPFVDWWQAPRRTDRQRLLRQGLRLAQEIASQGVPLEEALANAGLVLAGTLNYTHATPNGNGRTGRVVSYLLCGYEDTAECHQHLRLLLSSEGRIRWAVNPRPLNAALVVTALTETPAGGTPLHPEADLLREVPTPVVDLYHRAMRAVVLGSPENIPSIVLEAATQYLGEFAHSRADLLQIVSREQDIVSTARFLLMDSAASADFRMQVLRAIRHTAHTFAWLGRPTDSYDALDAGARSAAGGERTFMIDALISTAKVFSTRGASRDAAAILALLYRFGSPAAGQLADRELSDLARTAAHTGDHSTARECYQWVIESSGRDGRHSARRDLRILALVAMVRGDFASARDAAVASCAKPIPRTVEWPEPALGGDVLAR